MPANIAFTMGRYNAMYADKPAWHNLGTVVAGAQTPEEALRLAGTNFVVAKAAVFAKVPGLDDTGFVDTHLPGYAATYRTDTNDILGIVSSDYPIIQNITPMQMLAEIVRTKEAGIVAHAALGRGERLFAVLDLKRLTDIRISGDPSAHDAYLVAQWWHDGTGALTFGESMLRVECQNMADAQLAYAERKGRLARIVHRGDTADAVEEARRILGYAERDIRAFMDVLAIMADAPIPSPHLWIDGFTEKLIPIPPKMERPATRLEAREAIRHLFIESKTLIGVPKTPYRAFQAVTEYADHYRPLRVADEALVPARRFTTAVDGPAASLKQDAMRLLREEFEIR
jgi:phage/plasmid-like protein (TIGR03299 family)